MRMFYLEVCTYKYGFHNKINKEKGGMLVKKKSLILCLVFVMVLSLGLSGCAKQEPAPSDTASEAPAPEAPAKTQELLFATGGTAGTYYPLGGAIANIWNQIGRASCRERV